MGKIIKDSIIFAAMLFMVVYGENTYASGQDIATELNVRFFNTAENCEGQAAYICSGIVLRNNEGSDYTWTLSPYSIEREKFSTSFIRSDISNGVVSIYFYKIIGYGIILSPSNKKKYYSRCIFPVNGGSSSRGDHGCGNFGVDHKLDEDNSSCSKQNIKTATEWLAEYERFGALPCSFSSHSASEFNEALKAQNLFHVSHDNVMWNELVLNTDAESWDSSLIANDLVEAIYYNRLASGSGPGGTYAFFGLSGAQHEQRAYMELTNKWVPIIEINSDNIASPFSYSEEDQAIHQ